MDKLVCRWCLIVGIASISGIMSFCLYSYWTKQHPQATQLTFVAGPDGAATVFPLLTEPGKHYLVDSTGLPFLIRGDAVWSMIAGLTREEIILFLDDRRARGFNTLLVNLIEHKFARRAPSNIYGEPPFLKPADFSTPNDAYFKHVDWILRQASERGFLILLVPAYLGYQGSDQGWYREMGQNDREKLRGYGRFLGGRYRDFANIMWVQGGDYNPPDKSRTRAIAEGILEANPRALHTAHGAPETSAANYWGGEPWLKVNSVYTYGPACPAALRAYARIEAMPFFLIESAYEHERGATEASLRAQAYSALLCGAAGQVFGNNPIWHFGGRGIYEAPVDWVNALGGRGTESSTHLANLFAGLRWWELVPDTDGVLITRGIGLDDDRAVAAFTNDRSQCLVYLPSPRVIELDSRQFQGRRISARWFDPSSGEYSTAVPVRTKSGRSYEFRSKSRNSAGYGDWLLMVESDAKESE